QTYIAPTALALGDMLGMPRQADPRSWVHVPSDHRTNPDKQVTIDLPPSWHGDRRQQARLSEVAGHRLSMRNPDWGIDWDNDTFPRMWLRACPDPPTRVDFAEPEVRALVEGRPSGQFFLGMGPRRAPQYLDIIKGAPHVGWSIPTNGGKSTAVRGAIMQMLHDGGLALILDPKMDSHPWARDLPGVRYADTPKEIHEALVWLSGEVDRRNQIGKEHGDIYGKVDETLVGPRLLVIAEELNSMEIDLARYWREIRQPGDPLKPASMSALGRALNMGRSKRVYIWPIAQELLVQSLGGPAAKANLSTRILGRATTPTWNKLAPECKVAGRYPRKDMNQGRVYVVTTEEPTLVQAMIVDEQDARDYAMSGVVAVFPGNEAADPGRGSSAFPYGHSVGDLGHPGETGAAGDPGGEAGHPHLTLVPPVETDGELVTLNSAAERLALSLNTLRNASKRRPDFPSPVEEGGAGRPNKYRWSELQRWAKESAS
ncbi:MAG: hypothetical protein ACRDRL_18990, partial [Sciscionella sp.]